MAEIKAFYRRISRGIPAPKGTMFSGTGYVMTESPSAVEEEREIYIAEINARRYHLMPFPDSSGELYTTIKMLLNCDPEFRSEVWEILEDL
ncbi:hypothetical protein [Acinetobacter phage ABPH49]|nr:hypothetical protein [Acinetobacter phage ABPH49]